MWNSDWLSLGPCQRGSVSCVKYWSQWSNWHKKCFLRVDLLDQEPDIFLYPTSVFQERKLEGALHPVVARVLPL